MHYFILFYFISFNFCYLPLSDSERDAPESPPSRRTPIPSRVNLNLCVLSKATHTSSFLRIRSQSSQSTALHKRTSKRDFSPFPTWSQISSGFVNQVMAQKKRWIIWLYIYALSRKLSVRKTSLVWLFKLDGTLLFVCLFFPPSFHFCSNSRSNILNGGGMQNTMNR